MKRIILLLSIIIIGIICMGQNHYHVCDVTMGITTVGEIVYIDDYGFVLFDRSINKYDDPGLSVYLGRTKEYAVQTINAMKMLRKTGKTDTPYITKGYNNASTKLVITKIWGVDSLIIIVDGMPGYSLVLDNLVIYSERYINIINGFELGLY